MAVATRVLHGGGRDEQGPEGQHRDGHRSAQHGCDEGSDEADPDGRRREQVCADTTPPFEARALHRTKGQLDEQHRERRPDGPEPPVALLEDGIRAEAARPGWRGDQRREQRHSRWWIHALRHRGSLS
ncbi:MAG: hypothetical protein MUC96_19800 [Myxococcaceae bacterium]|jgi:hypothetical protein|nr:hypothetical protein [Myxococcaceae bacterium]